MIDGGMWNKRMHFWGENWFPESSFRIEWTLYKRTVTKELDFYSSISFDKRLEKTDLTAQIDCETGETGLFVKKIG